MLKKIFHKICHKKRHKMWQDLSQNMSRKTWQGLQKCHKTRHETCVRTSCLNNLWTSKSRWIFLVHRLKKHDIQTWIDAENKPKQTCSTRHWRNSSYLVFFCFSFHINWNSRCHKRLFGSVNSNLKSKSENLKWLAQYDGSTITLRRKQRSSSSSFIWIRQTHKKKDQELFRRRLYSCVFWGT